MADSNTYSKPALTPAQAVKWLRDHNIAIGQKEEAEAERFLKAEATFRIMGYARDIKGGCAFADLKAIYFFDRQLRNALLEAFEIVEVQLRNTVSNTLFLKNPSDAFMYERPELFAPAWAAASHARWLAELRQKVELRAQEGVVSYYRTRYKDIFPRLPIGAVVELMSFAELVNFCDRLEPLTRAAICHNYCLPPRVFFNWLDNYADVRNLCAHHRMLYNRRLNRPHKPLDAAWPEGVENDRVGAVMLSLYRYLATGCGQGDRNKDFLSHWKKRVNKLLGKNRAVPKLMCGYGLPEAFSL